MINPQQLQTIIPTFMYGLRLLFIYMFSKSVLIIVTDFRLGIRRYQMGHEYCRDLGEVLDWIPSVDFFAKRVLFINRAQRHSHELFL